MITFNPFTNRPDLVSGIGSTLPGGTSGSVLFIDSSGNLAQDNSNLFWDNTNKILGVGTQTGLGAVTASGGKSFSSVAFGLASIGHIIHTSGWDGSGFVFGNSTAGTNAFSMVFNGDVAYFGLLAPGGTQTTLGTWDTTGFKTTGRIFSGAPATGGIWVDGGTNQFVGSFDSSKMGFYNNGWNFVMDSSGKSAMGTTTTTSARLTFGGTASATGIDLATNDQYLEARVIRNSLNAGDKDLYFNFQAGSGSKLHLYSNNVETLTASAGNVGVGTSSITERLTVVDVGNSNVYTGTFGVYANNLTQGIAFGYTGISKVGSAANTDLNIDAKGTGNILLQTNSTGKVGIGTASPGQLLHINSPAGVDPLTQISVNGTTYAYIGVASGSNAVINGSIVGDLGIRSQAKSILFSTDSGTSAAMAIKAGLVGIGVISPSSILHLKAGTATANTAPLQFNAGTAETSTRAGIMEFANSETGLTFVAVSTRRAFVFDTVTQTLTNKRVTKRVSTTASSSTPTPNADTDDEYTVTALAAGATFGAPSGTPTEGQMLIIRIKDNGTSRTLAWNAIYRAGSDVALPTTTTLSKTLYVGFIYNNTDSKWDILAKADGV